MSSEYAFLYVEDDENMIEAMNTSINLMRRSEEYIFNMKVVNSSDEAIRMLDNDVFDFVLIDIKLSGEDSGDTVIEKIKKDKIDIIFGEKNYSDEYVTIIKNETGIEVRKLEHLTTGAYRADSFEKFIKVDLDEVVSAIKYVKNKNKK